MNEHAAVFLALLSEDKLVISYRPRFAALTDSALSAILLQQIIHWWKVKERQPFYKFRSPCKHTRYQDGQSWCEELEWNKYEFDNALKVIATKITTGVKKQDVLDTDMPERRQDESEPEFATRLAAALKSIVIYWTDSNRITWYQVNENLLGKFVGRIYLDKSYGLRYLEKSKVKSTQVNRTVKFTSNSEITKDKRRESTPKISKRTISEQAQHALINAWVEAMRFDAADMGASFISEKREKCAARMLKWPTPPTPEEIKAYSALRRKDNPQYEFTWIADDLPKYRAKNAKKVIQLSDPAHDLSIQHPVTPMLLDRAVGGDE